MKTLWPIHCDCTYLLGNSTTGLVVIGYGDMDFQMVLHMPNWVEHSEHSVFTPPELKRFLSAFTSTGVKRCEQCNDWTVRYSCVHIYISISFIASTYCL